MKRRRWILLLMVFCFLCLPIATQAETATVELAEIGLRYTPLSDETCLTREATDEQAFSALQTDSDTLISYMTENDVYLICLPADGRRIELTVSGKPAGVTGEDYYRLTRTEKDAFLVALARKGNYGTALWEADGYALFASTAEAQGLSAESDADLSLSTLYLSQVYTFRMEVDGEATQAEREALLSTASRTLRLGAKAEPETEQTEPEALTLPDTEPDSSLAEFTYQSMECSLVLNPVPAAIGATCFTLSGVTEPGARLRYYVGSSASSHVSVGEDGTFSLTVRGLTADAANDVEVAVSLDDRKTIVDFTVTVVWQDSPLALEAPGAVAADTVTLNGLMLPGSTVELSEGRGAVSAVDDTGAFTLSLMLSALGGNDFSLRVQSDGYRRLDYAFTVTRVQSEAEMLSELETQAQAADYRTLVADAAAFAGRVLCLSGTVGELSYTGGQPQFVLTADGDRYAVFCDDLTAVYEGKAMSLYATLTGETTDNSGIPAVTLTALIP